MDLETARELIKKYTIGHTDFVNTVSIAERYYRKKTDILFAKSQNEDEISPIRNADNRISSSFYSLLVNQKAAYAFTAPPAFDVGNQKANKEIRRALGDNYTRYCKRLCVDASNAGVGCVHYWINDKNEFKWSVVDSKSVIPIYNDSLESDIIAVLRVYTDINDDGKAMKTYELWNDTECAAYQREINSDLSHIFEYNCFSMADMPNVYSNVLRHDFGRVPFIFFNNNAIKSSDLENVKGYIDSYDKVYSGFVNDLEDIQEIVFLLSGYEGEDPSDFLKKLKKYKTVKLDADVDNRGDLRTLTIDIPVEARRELLNLARKAIFEQGQGVDPDPSNFGNSSGVALKYLYSLLDLKVGDMETEFRSGFAELVRAICRCKNISCEDIIQTWTRTMVTNDVELATIAQQSVGVVSNRTIIKNHPWVDNPDKEEEYITEEANSQKDRYSQPNSKESLDKDDKGEKDE